MSKIKIFGVELENCEVLRNEATKVTLGIKAGGKHYWFVDPICDSQGNVSPEVPPYAPGEIRRITHELPDLTGKHMDEVRAEFQSLQNDSRTMSAEALCKRYGWKPTKENKIRAEKYRRRNLALSFEDYLADALGYIEHLDEGLSLAARLAWKIQEREGSEFKAAYERVERIGAVVMYADAAHKRIYVAGIKVESAKIVRPEEPLKEPLTKRWYSEGFRVVYRISKTGKKSNERTLTVPFRALCQILSEKPDRRERFGKIESLLGERIRKLEKEIGQDETDLSFRGKKQLREILKRPDGKTLIRWGILKVEAKSQKEKYLILLPPKKAT